MGVTTNLVQTILFTEILAFTILLIPLPPTFKKKIFTSLTDSLLIRSLKHIFIAVYAMITLLFVDSAFRTYTQQDTLLVLYNQRNFYLTGFTLFLGIVFRRFLKMVVVLYKQEENAEVLKKQALNQKKYVEDIIGKLRSKEEEIKDMEKKIVKSDTLVTQAKNNEKEYFRILEKYNNLKETIESKKDR